MKTLALIEIILGIITFIVLLITPTGTNIHSPLGIILTVLLLSLPMPAIIFLIKKVI